MAEQNRLADERGDHDQEGRHDIRHHVTQDDAGMTEAARGSRIHVASRGSQAPSSAPRAHIAV